MKTFFIILFLSLCKVMLYGQTNNPRATIARNLPLATINTAVSAAPLDSALLLYPVAKGPFAAQVTPVPIPVVGFHGEAHSAMPIKQLSGQDLAPMPGTAPLDARERKAGDSTKTRPIYFKQRELPAK